MMLRNLLGAHDNKSSGMNTILPPEILQDIFTLYVHDRTKMAQIDVDMLPISPLRPIAAYPDSQAFPTDLTSVCRLWREVAISMPQLWATIHVQAPSCEGGLRMFELWLERSAGSTGTYPLNLGIEQVRHPDPDLELGGELLLKRALCLATSHSQRCRSFSLELRYDSERLLSSLVAANFSNLREVTLGVQWWTNRGLHHLLSILCSSSSLQSVEFGNWMSDYPLDRPLMDLVCWSRVQRLAFPAIGHGACLYIMAASAKALQQISISLLTEANIPRVSEPARTTMYHLQSLHIDGVLWDRDDHDIGLFFDKLTLPSLHTLRLPNGFDKLESVCPHLTARGWRSLLSLLQRSKCKLEVFEFGAEETTGPVWIMEASLTEHITSPLFKHLIRLRVTSGIGFELESPQLLDSLSEVCEDTQGPRFLPRLETLVLDSVSSVGKVQEMVANRVAAYRGYNKSNLRRVSAELGAGGFLLDMELPR